MREPESELLAKLVVAAGKIASGADEALELLGPVPADTVAFESLDRVQRTAARALLKAVEQQQDVIARLFRTYLAAEAVDVVVLTARDVANQMEKFGALEDAYLWSDLTKLRNRLAHEYPVSVSAQLERISEAAAAVPVLRAILDRLTTFLLSKGYLT